MTSALIGQIAVAFALLVASVIVGAPAGFLCWKLYHLQKSMEKIGDLSSLATLPAVIEKYQEGVIKIGEAQIEAINRLEVAVSDFKALMFAGDPRGVQIPDEEKASEEWEIQNLVRSGIKREDAEGRVKERKLYEGFRIG